ncbi:MAG: hypothetical protein WC651_00045 [Candidatus Gracilibacteria bacterium]
MLDQHTGDGVGEEAVSGEEKVAGGEAGEAVEPGVAGEVRAGDVQAAVAGECDAVKDPVEAFFDRFPSTARKDWVEMYGSVVEGARDIFDKGGVVSEALYRLLSSYPISSGDLGSFLGIVRPLFSAGVSAEGAKMFSEYARVLRCSQLDFRAVANFEALRSKYKDFLDEGGVVSGFLGTFAYRGIKPENVDKFFNITGHLFKGGVSPEGIQVFECYAHVFLMRGVNLKDVEIFDALCLRYDCDVRMVRYFLGIVNHKGIKALSGILDNEILLDLLDRIEAGEKGITFRLARIAVDVSSEIKGFIKDWSYGERAVGPKDVGGIRKMLNGRIGAESGIRLIEMK